MFYRVYEDRAGAERPWPLSHIPLVIDGREWQQLQAGLMQRASLLESVLADVYGSASLVRDGRLPAAVIAGNPEFLRPMVGVMPPGGAHLRFCAFDVGRGADGSWWVLADRTQAPSGAGYALENRLALSRAIPDIYGALHVERLAPFFQSFQAALAGLNRREDSRVCLLTPGPMNDTYFEHAYLARYLGFLLVEGEDLRVREDGVFIRTVSGLKRVEVLVRRLDADFADPLELNPRSRLGVPGLAQAARDGKIAIVNQLGSGVIEARAMLSFLPALAPSVIGGELALPNVATWWLGQANIRAEVLGRLDGMVVGSAFVDGLSGDDVDQEVLGANLDDAARTRLMDVIGHRGVDLVAKEAVTLSTMPVWREGRLEPRPFVLRLFLALVEDGWKVMPGGFVRVADDLDARAVSLQQGGRTADAWVLSAGPVAPTSLLPTAERIIVKRATGPLPSRAADNLFWVARYVERAESTLRLVRALLNRIAETDDEAASLTANVGSLLVAWGAMSSDIPQTKPVFIAAATLQRSGLEGTIPSLVGAARAAASVIRDRFSPDAWQALNDLVVTIDAPIAPAPAERAMFERVNAALRIIASFSGLAQENMSQLTGWRFLELGRRIERAIGTCRFARQFAGGTVSRGALDVLLELADSQITYRMRYVMVPARAPVIDLVVLDPNNPRSIAFQLNKVEAHLGQLPKRQADSRLSPPEQIAAALASTLRTTEAARIDAGALVDVETSLMRLADAIAAYYFTLSDYAEEVWADPE